MNNALDALTQINLDDLVKAFGWQNSPVLDCLARFIFRRTAREFARQILEFDSDIASRGFAAAAQRVLKYYVRQVRVHEAHNIPPGGWLALSNHPGLTDTLALCAALGREDLKIIALRRPFLTSLPQISRRLFYVTDELRDRVSLVRQVAYHLRAGGAALTFPAGEIEPDPAVYSGAVESLAAWTDSAAIFLRLAPEAHILPIVVRHVMWETIALSPILRIKREPRQREALAASLQLLANLSLHVRPITVDVQIGRPISAGALGGTGPAAVHEATLAEMKRLIETPPPSSATSLV